MTVAQAIAKAGRLVRSADDYQLDEIREYWETRAECRKRLLRLAEISPSLVLALMGA